LKRNEIGPPKCHFMDAKDYSILATLLTTYTESGIRFPPALALVARQAIRLREVQAKKFPDTKLYRARNKAHQIFIEELRFVLRILESTTGDLDLGRLSFSTLCSTDIVPAVWPQNARRQISTPSVTLDGELGGSEFDKRLAICTFFEDMDAIRNSLSSTWEDYAAGRLCLTAAAVTTDTAFAIMKASCEEICGLVADASTWRALAMLFREVLGDSSEQEAEWLDWTCAKVAFRLMELCNNLRPGHLLVKNPERIDDYDATRDRSTWSIEEQDDEDTAILSELFEDIVVLSRMKIDLPAQDELTAGLRAMVDGNSFESMPMYVVFAAQMFLDIHHTLRGRISRAFESLQTTGRTVCDIVDEHFRHTSDQNKASIPLGNTESLKRIKVYAKDWIENDAIGAAVYRGTARRGTTKPFRLLQNHPVLCGLKILRIQMLLQDSGIELCNAFGSVLCLAHIYHAATQSGGLRQLWRDIDYIVTLHSSKRIFSGRAPTLAADYFDRFVAALNENQRTTYARMRPRGSAESRNAKRRTISLKVTSPVTDVFKPRYIQNSRANITPQNIIAMTSVVPKRMRTSDLSGETVRFLREMGAKRRHTTMELLRVVCEGVAAEEMHLLFDYVGLHRRGADFLRKVYEAFRPDLESFLGEMDVRYVSNLTLVTAGVFEIIKDVIRSLNEFEVDASKDMLGRLARVVADFLGEDESKGPGGESFWPARVLTNTILEAYWERSAQDDPSG